MGDKFGAGILGDLANFLSSDADSSVASLGVPAYNTNLGAGRRRAGTANTDRGIGGGMGAVTAARHPVRATEPQIAYDDQLLAAFETLRGKVANTELYHPCLQVMQHLMSYPKNDAQADKYWRIVDQIMMVVSEKQYTLSGREGLRLVHPSAMGGNDSDSDSEDGRRGDEERDRLLADILRMTTDYEGQIEKLERAVRRAEDKVSKRRLARKRPPEGTVSKRQFRHMEARYREELMGLQLELVKRDKQLEALRAQLSNTVMMGGGGGGAAAAGVATGADITGLQARHALRAGRMDMLTGGGRLASASGAYPGRGTDPAVVAGASTTAELLGVLAHAPRPLSVEDSYSDDDSFDSFDGDDSFTRSRRVGRGSRDRRGRRQHHRRRRDNYDDGEDWERLLSSVPQR